MTRTTRRAAVGSAAFFLVGPLLEAVVGPWVVSGFHRGDGMLDGPLARVAGGALIGAGAAVVLACFALFVVQGRGTPSPLAPPAELVDSGPYAWSRNPMYVATAGVILGEGLLLARPLLVGCAGLYLATTTVLVLRAEEPLLARRHGAAWDAYAARVRRLL